MGGSPCGQLPRSAPRCLHTPSSVLSACFASNSGRRQAGWSGHRQGVDSSTEVTVAEQEWGAGGCARAVQPDYSDITSDQGRTFYSSTLLRREDQAFPQQLSLGHEQVFFSACLSSARGTRFKWKQAQEPESPWEAGRKGAMKRGAKGEEQEDAAS